MNGAHFHLLVNHFPIILPIVGILVLVIGLIARSEAVKRTGHFIFILGAVASLVAMSSGEEAEEVVETLAGISESYIETHEEAAEQFAILTYILGVLAMLGLWASFKRKSFANIIAIATLVLAMITVFFAQKTGTSGGEIRHTEIRDGALPYDTGQPNEENTESDD